MEPNEEVVLELEECSEDDVSSMKRLFHWQMEDYELFSQLHVGGGRDRIMVREGCVCTRVWGIHGRRGPCE